MTGLRHVAQAASALAVSMGVGRFAYTPILPLMIGQAGLTAETGANVATANYVGYLAGAVVSALAPDLVRSPAVHRSSLVLLVATLTAMPLTTSVHAWFVLRFLAGAASAVVFVIAVHALADRPGWGMGGVGAGIALSGLLVLALPPQWKAAWWATAALAAVLAAGAWTLRPTTPPARPTVASRPRRPYLPFSALFASYTLEGVGYIIAGTFLVAAINASSPGPLGGLAWVLVGLAATLSPALLAWLSRRWTQADLLLVALVLQAIGIALPAVLIGVAPALIAAFLFGATFLGVATTALTIGTRLGFPRAVALLTAGYSAGQIVGPLVATPLLRYGYHNALLLASAIVLAAAVAAGLLRITAVHHEQIRIAAHAQTVPRTSTTVVQLRVASDSRRMINVPRWRCSRGSSECRRRSRT
jgi:MFS family permease